MAHTHTRMLVHMVFATHERRPLIGPTFKPRLLDYMVGIARELDCYVYAVDGVADHCPLVLDLAPTIALAEFANKLKSGSSKWARRDGGQPDFKWQRGYGAFSVNQDSLERAVAYVKNQESHHARVSLRDELESFMRLHGMIPDSEFIDGAYRPDAEQA